MKKIKTDENNDDNESVNLLVFLIIYLDKCL